MSATTRAERECPACQKSFTAPQRKGRPPTYCGATCRAKARSRRSGARDRADPGAAKGAAVLSVRQGTQVVEAAECMEEQLRALKRMASAGGSEVETLRRCCELQQEMDTLTAAAVARARAASVSWNTVGGALKVSDDTARKHWSPRRVDKLLADSRRRGTQGRRAGALGVAVGGEPAGGGECAAVPVEDAAQAPPGEGSQSIPAGREGGIEPVAPEVPAATGAAEQLSAHLSRLQRSCGRSLRDLAAEVGVSPSYVSRLLAGERVPSWAVARRLALACGADLTGVRPLWQAARGGVASRQETAGDQAAAALHDAVCELYLAAARPAPSVICEQADGPLSTRQVSKLLEEGQVLDWPVVDRVVHALRGRPADLRPLWDRAAGLPPAPAVPSPLPEKAGVRRIPAESFG